MKLNMKKAFTLVEMLIVIVIIGILAAALIPRLTGIQSRARDTGRNADLRQIGVAIATYQLDNGTYPITGGSSLTGVGYGGITESAGFSGALIKNSALTVNNTLGVLVFQGLLKDLPTETNSPNDPYMYSYYASGSIFTLSSLNEGGGLNANFFSGAGTFSGFSGLPNIYAVLCNSVTENSTGIYVAGGACKSPLTKKTARFIYAN